MCKILSFTVDRKTWKDINVEIFDSEQNIDYSLLVDAYADDYMQSKKREAVIDEQNGDLSYG